MGFRSKKTGLMHVTHTFVFVPLGYLDVFTLRIEFILVVLPVTMSADGFPIAFASSRKHQPPPTPFCAFGSF